MVMVVHAIFAALLAIAPGREGTLGKLRLSPIGKALQEKLYGQQVVTKPCITRPARKSPSETRRLQSLFCCRMLSRV